MSERPNIKEKISKALVIGLASTAVAACSGSNAEGNHTAPEREPVTTTVTETVPETPAPAVEIDDSCIDATHEEQSAVDSLLASPPKVVDVTREEHAIYAPRYVNKRPGFQRELATDLGLTLPDMSVDDLWRLRPTASLEEASRVIEDAYGVTVEVRAQPQDRYGIAIDSSDELSKEGKERARDAMLATASALSDLPVELIKLSELQTIRFQPIKDDGLKDYGLTIGGVANTREGVMILNIEAPMRSSIIYHELGHFIDYRLCGGNFYFDKDLSRINEGYSVPPYTESYEYEDYDGPPHAIWNGRSNLPHVASEYGATSPVEDKATIFELVVGGSLDDIPKDSALGEKYELWWDRLFATSPALAEYLIRRDAIEFNVAEY